MPYTFMRRALAAETVRFKVKSGGTLEVPYDGRNEPPLDKMVMVIFGRGLPLMQTQN